MIVEISTLSHSHTSTPAGVECLSGGPVNVHLERKSLNIMSIHARHLNLPSRWERVEFIADDARKLTAIAFTCLGELKCDGHNVVSSCLHVFAHRFACFFSRIPCIWSLGPFHPRDSQAQSPPSLTPFVFCVKKEIECN